MSEQKRRAARRVTKPVVEERVNGVINVLLGGGFRREIMQYIATQQKQEGPKGLWGDYISPRQIDNYIAKANDAITTMVERDRGVMVGKATQRLNRIYGTAMAGGELKSAIMAQAELNKIYGVHAPAKKEISGPEGGPIQVQPTIDLSKLTEEELELLERVSRRLQQA